MQTSRVNGLTSGVFAFLEPASCLNQKGSDTRSDNTIFLSGYDDLHAPGFYCRNAGSGENLLFPVSGVGQLSNAKASVLHLHGVLPVSVAPVPPVIVAFFQKNGNTPDVIRQYFPAESGRKRKRT